MTFAVSAKGNGSFHDVLEKAQSRSTAAESKVGVHYAKTGVPKQRTSPIESFFKAAKQGNRKAQKKLGDAAARDDAAAQVALGYLYANGWGVAQDYVQAAGWIRKALEHDFMNALDELDEDVRKGDGHAKVALAYMYANGLFGVTQNYGTAADWLSKASVEQDFATALDELDNPGHKGDGHALISLGYMYINGLRGRPDYPQASDCFRKAAAELDFAMALADLHNTANNGDGRAQIALGHLYADGWCVERDDAQAAAWFRKAGDQGLSEGLEELGTMYRDGRGVPQDYEQARAYFTKSASDGDLRSEFNLATMPGAPADDPSILVWLWPNARRGNADAQASLGLFYLSRGTTLEDYTNAYIWLDLAALGRLETLSRDEVAKARDDAASHLTREVLLQTQKRVRNFSENGDFTADQ